MTSNPPRIIRAPEDTIDVDAATDRSAASFATAAIKKFCRNFLLPTPWGGTPREPDGLAGWHSVHRSVACDENFRQSRGLVSGKGWSGG